MLTLRSKRPLTKRRSSTTALFLRWWRISLGVASAALIAAGASASIDPEPNEYDFDDPALVHRLDERQVTATEVAPVSVRAEEDESRYDPEP